MLPLVLAAAAGFVLARRFPRALPQIGGAHSGQWIQSAIRRPGQLHRDLGVPPGQRIPTELVRWAATQPGALGQRGRLALTLERLRPHGPRVGLRGGLADRYPERARALLSTATGRKALLRGARVEREHTSSPSLAREIALDHLVEDPRYYAKLLNAGL